MRHMQKVYLSLDSVDRVGFIVVSLDGHAFRARSAAMDSLDTGVSIWFEVEETPALLDRPYGSEGRRRAMVMLLTSIGTLPRGFEYLGVVAGRTGTSHIHVLVNHDGAPEPNMGEG